MSDEAKPETTDPDITATRRTLVTRALEFAAHAHGHGELPAGFMSDAVDCLTGVLRDVEEACLGPAEASAPASALEAAWAVEVLDAHARKHAAEHFGAAIEVGVSGNGENWNCSVEGAAFHKEDITHSLLDALVHRARALYATDPTLPAPPQKGDT